MLEQLGSSIIFYAFYTEDGAGDTGLTVTVDVWEVTRAGTATEIVTGGSATEIGDGVYRYLLAAGSVDAEAEYIAVFKTADSDTDQQHIPALWAINRANVEDIDDILTDTGTTLDGKLDTIDGNVDDILEDTGTTLYDALAEVYVWVSLIRDGMGLSGTAAGGGDNYITLPGAASASDQIYEGNMIYITDGTGMGQSRMITDYFGDTKRAYVHRLWVVNPDDTSKFQITPFVFPAIAQHGLAQGGTNTTITLSENASDIDDIYNGSLIYISTSTGTGESRIITDYDGGTKVATVYEAWAVNPTSDSVYQIFPDRLQSTEAIEAIKAKTDDLTFTVANRVDASATVDAQEVADAIEPLIPTADNIWAATSRTLTQTATEISAAISGSSITQVRGNSWSIEITGVTLDSNKQQFMLKKSSGSSDDNAILFIDSETGLLTINGVTATAAQNSKASLAYVGTTLTVTVDADITAQLPADTLDYGIQYVTAAGAVTEAYSGDFVITADIVRATE